MKLFQLGGHSKSTKVKVSKITYLGTPPPPFFPSDVLFE